MGEFSANLFFKEATNGSIYFSEKKSISDNFCYVFLALDWRAPKNDKHWKACLVIDIIFHHQQYSDVVRTTFNCFPLFHCIVFDYTSSCTLSQAFVRSISALDSALGSYLRRGEEGIHISRDKLWQAKKKQLWMAMLFVFGTVGTWRSVKGKTLHFAFSYHFFFLEKQSM